jgi:hypothetical protein
VTVLQKSFAMLCDSETNGSSLSVEPALSADGWCKGLEASSLRATMAATVLSKSLEVLK